MESRVEYRNIGNLGKKFLAGADAFEVRGVVERCEIRKFIEVAEDFWCDACRFSVFFTTVNHAMADGDEFAGVGEYSFGFEGF